jgi:hypothetical protein
MTLQPSFDPWDGICTPRLGVAKLTRMAFEGQDLRALWHELMEKVIDDAAGAGMGMDLSIIAQLLGDKPTGLAIQNEVLAYQRFYRSPCSASKPRLRVLALAAVMDIGGNTPIEFLLEGSDIELVTFYVTPGMALPDHIPNHDIAIVVAADDAMTRETLQTIETWLPHWPRPVLNRPAKIMGQDRDRLYRNLNGIAGLVIPQTARLSREDVEDLIDHHAALARILPGTDFPLIIRPIGSHAGFGLAKLDNWDVLANYIDERAEEAFFLSPYVDYAGADGLFRKYRLAFIDGRPYACHMAVAEVWKVWYLNAEMAVSATKRSEEAQFMREFDGSFAARHERALGEMARRIGLDYFVVDCAETPDGRLLVFEADNAAIVHDMDSPAVYPYKPAQMRKIFQAMQAMLYRRSGAAGGA